jgi:hypothetical protein
MFKIEHCVINIWCYLHVDEVGDSFSLNPEPESKRAVINTNLDYTANQALTLEKSVPNLVFFCLRALTPVKLYG